MAGEQNALRLVEREIVGRVNNRDLASISIDTVRGLASIAHNFRNDPRGSAARDLLERWMGLKPLVAQDLMSRGGLMRGPDEDTMYFNPVVIRGDAEAGSKEKRGVFPILAIIGAATAIYLLTRG